jgi:uncharacterized paraquat-inducible protein A
MLTKSDRTLFNRLLTEHSISCTNKQPVCLNCKNLSYTEKPFTLSCARCGILFTEEDSKPKERIILDTIVSGKSLPMACFKSRKK